MKAAADILEDLEWLDSTGVGATEAAERTDFRSAESMEQWLYRHDHYDLWKRLKGRDPAGTHDKPNRRRLMSIDTSPDQIATLLSEADKSTRARTRKRAERIRSLVAELGFLLSAERDEDQFKESARKEVEKLERKLAEAKARLRGGSEATGSSDAKEIRAWAAEVGLDCPSRGRIPEVVRSAYDEREAAS